MAGVAELVVLNLLPPPPPPPPVVLAGSGALGGFMYPSVISYVEK